MRAVNLLPDAPRRRPRRAGVRGVPATPLLAAGAALLLVGLGYWGYSARQEAERLDGEVRSAEVARDGLRTELADFRTVARRDEIQRARRGAVVGLVTGRTDWERVIRDVATVTPPGVWLTDLTTTAGPANVALEGGTAAAGATPGAGTGGASVKIEGVAPSQPRVGLVMARMGSVAGLGTPKLVSSGAEDIGERRMVRFVITATADRRAQGRATLEPVSDTGGRP